MPLPTKLGSDRRQLRRWVASGKAPLFPVSNHGAAREFVLAPPWIRATDDKRPPPHTGRLATNSAACFAADMNVE
ncbi:hypothetical protein MRX96_055109 [Rhipicephalus microplus]